MRFVLTVLVSAAGIWVASRIFDDVDWGGEWWVFLLAALVLSVVNMIVRPVVILLALPAVILTLGLALLLVNALMLWLTDLIVPDFEVGGFWTTVGAALVISLVNVALHALLPDRGSWRRRFG